MDNNGKKPLDLAKSSVQFEIKWAITKAVDDLLSKDEKELLKCAGAGNIGEVKRLLDQGVSPSVRGGDNRTALHYAARKGQAEVLKCLLATGADVDAAGEDGKTPLHEAAAGCHKNSV
jgi:ankyrin